MNHTTPCCYHLQSGNVSPPLTLLLIQYAYYIHAHTYTYIHIYYTYTYIHTRTHLYVHTHTRIAVHVYMNFYLLMEGGMVGVFRILRVMPQPAIHIANISFVTNYGKVRDHIFLNNNILYQLLGGFMGHRKMSIRDTCISP